MDHNFSLNYRCLACIEHDIIGLQASHAQKADESEYILPKTALAFFEITKDDSHRGFPKRGAAGPVDIYLC